LGYLLAAVRLPGGDESRREKDTVAIMQVREYLAYAWV
jgi:hypothetical protein